ncbi:hypothetical protein, partial [Burkholderia orbicola]|uniref:hypothetical protein n=1 Tax=Burkholderia orbicola TaxID=2978683 RepID=UPI002FE236F0
SAYSLSGHDTPKRLDQTQDGLAGRLQPFGSSVICHYVDVVGLRRLIRFCGGVSFALLENHGRAPMRA